MEQQEAQGGASSKVWALLYQRCLASEVVARPASEQQASLVQSVQDELLQLVAVEEGESEAGQ